MKKTLLTAFALLCGVGVASAAPISLPGDTPLFFQFVNYEQVNLAAPIDVPGSYGPANNWGVFVISNIQSGHVSVPNQDIQGNGFNDVFSAVPGGAQIYGIFYDLTATSATTLTGGHLDLYWSDTPVVNIEASAPDLATVTAFTSGTFLGRLDFASGIDPGDSTTFIASTINPNTITGSQHGSADSFANVDTSAGGAWADALDGNWFDTAFGARDIRFSNDYNLTSNGWDTDGAGPIVGLRSNDPGRVFTSPVPEPATLTLMGLGLVGCAGFVARRRRKTA